VQKPTGAIRALTPIATGEEITIDYLGHNPDSCSAVGLRRVGLLSEYGFQCGCPFCINAAASDAPRHIIRQALSTVSFRGANADTNRKVNSQNCNQALRDRVYGYLRAVEEKGIKDGRLGTACVPIPSVSRP
jgi:hypothetical protein